MPRFVDIQPGGEKYLAFALSKLRQLKAWMKPAGLRVMSKHYWVNATDKIWIKALDLGNDVWWDWIRIEAGGGLWDFYAQNDQGIFVAVIDAPLAAVLSGSATIHKTSRALGRSWLLVTAAGQLKTADPEQSVARVREGEFDTFTTHELFMASPVTGPGYAAVSFKTTPATRAFYTKDKKIEPAENPVGSQRLYALEDDFFYAHSTAAGIFKVYDLDGGSLLVDAGGAATHVIAAPEATFHDALIPRARRAVALEATVDLVSKKHGLFSSATIAASINLNLDGILAATNRNSAYTFTLMERDFTWQIKCFAVHSTFDPDTGALTGYTTSEAGPILIGDPDIAEGTGVLLTVSANKTSGYAFVIGGFDDGHTVLSSLSDAGSLVDLQSDPAGNHGSWNYLAAATPENVWLAAWDGGSNVYLFNQSGLIQSFGITATADPFVYAGRVGEAVFFRVKTAANQWRLVGSDGTNIDIRDGLLAGFSPGTGVGGHVWAPEKNETYWVWGGEIPNPDTPPPTNVSYVFHRPRAAIFKSYAVPTGTTATVDVPALATCYNHEEFEG